VRWLLRLKVWRGAGRPRGYSLLRVLCLVDQEEADKAVAVEEDVAAASS
jgi:hypothetical protein